MMTIQEIVGYIRLREAQGAGDVEIDNELMDRGATVEQIDEANDVYCAEYAWECHNEEGGR